MLPVDSGHNSRILDQFTRQAVPFSSAPAIGNQGALHRIVEMAKAGPDDTVLDVACGPGLLVCAFARVVQHATGIDLTPAMLEQARETQRRRGLQNVSWQQGDVLPLPYSAGKFSIVSTALPSITFSIRWQCSRKYAGSASLVDASLSPIAHPPLARPMPSMPWRSSAIRLMFARCPLKSTMLCLPARGSTRLGLRPTALKANSKIYCNVLFPIREIVAESARFLRTRCWMMHSIWQRIAKMEKSSTVIRSQSWQLKSLDIELCLRFLQAVTEAMKPWGKFES